MATSGVNTFNTTESTIITDALLMLQVVDPGEIVKAEDYSTAQRMLNMLKETLSIECNLWVTEDITHTLTPGTASYTVGTGLSIDTVRPLRLEHARRTDGANEIPMEVVSRQDYMSLPNKLTQSACLQVYYDPQLANGVLYCWPTGDAINTDIILTFKRPIEDFVANSNNPDLPKEWHLPLVYILADMLSLSYVGASAPPGLAAKAAGMMKLMTEWDEEDVSISFYPEQR